MIATVPFHFTKLKTRYLYILNRTFILSKSIESLMKKSITTHQVIKLFLAVKLRFRLQLKLFACKVLLIVFEKLKLSILF